jgi:twitching motility protein PilU
MSTAAQKPTSMMERILHLMAEKKASDVYLSAHAPATIKIDGVYHPINSQLLPPEAVLNLLAEVAPPNRIEELKETGELNMALPIYGVGNFRLSAMRQRGTYAAVVRFISPTIPTLDALNLPDILSRLVLEKRGLILMVGATGCGKSTSLASMLDHRNKLLPGHILTIEDPIEYVFTNRRSIIVAGAAALVSIGVLCSRVDVQGRSQSLSPPTPRARCPLWPLHPLCPTSG